MSIRYTEEYIIKTARGEIENFKNFYKSEILNYKSKTKDTNVKIEEVIAKFLLDEGIESLFQKIENINREISYASAKRDGTIPNNESNRHEERYCIELFNLHKNKSADIKPFDHLGEIIDYQIPLKPSLNEEFVGVGKIDLISKTDNNIWLLEVKTSKNKETLLRCILEISTYYQLLNKDKFLKDFNLSILPIKKGILKQIENENEKEEFVGVESGKLEYLKKIIKLLEIEIFFINNKQEITQMVLE
ncbi:hypothetical protein AB3N58_06795 [Leptospira sp. WS60.C2]